MPMIVELSMLYDVSKVNQNMALQRLFDAPQKRADGRVMGFFKSAANHALSIWAYVRDASSLFRQYEVGAISTDIFIDTLMGNMPFVEDIRCEAQRKQVMDAWNDPVVVSVHKQTMMAHLLNKAQDENMPIYIIGNTNPMHMQKIISQWQQCFSDISWQSVDLYAVAESKRTKIAENRDIHLYLSYHAKKDTAQLINDKSLLINEMEIPQGERLIFYSDNSRHIGKAEDQGFDDFYHEAEFIIPDTTGDLSAVIKS